MTPIFHITSRAEADEALRSGTYVAAAFGRDGFIHCSYARQLTRVANANFHGRSDLVLLEIDRDRVGCEVVDENLEGGSDLFPHVYGPLPMSAVTAIVDFPCLPDGSFELPADVPS
ncbi:MAG TPA: DUF952 domain-containing protein [Pyrinomonadaceae bacterium]